MSEPEAPRSARAGPIVIRPIRPDDAEAVYAVRLQPSVLRNTMATPSERLEHVRRRIDALGPDDHQFVAEVGGSVVGTAGLHVASGKRRHVGSVGIMVHEDHQGRGVGRALMLALLEVADRYLRLERIELDVAVDNHAAIRLYEQLGFEREGVKRRALLVDGEYADLLVMARLRGTPIS